MRITVALLALSLIAACGIDGEPSAPPPKEGTTPGVSVSGDARIGVVGSA